MKRIILPVFLIIAFILINCTGTGQNTSEDEDFFDFTEPEITSISPDDNDKGIEPFADITVTFSEPVNEDSAEQAFSLSADGGGSTKGRFSWKNDNTMIYTPINGWVKGEKYTVIIERSLTDKNRNRLQNKFTSSFYIGSDFTHPVVERVTSNPYVQQNQVVITVFFSKSMDITSLQNAVSVNPSFKYRLELTDGVSSQSVLTVYALENLDSMNEYSMKISLDAMSSSGLHILREYAYDFAMYFDTVKPEIISVFQGTNLDMNDLTYTIGPEAGDENSAAPVNLITKKGLIIITFSEQTDKQSVTNSIDITPDISYKYYWTSDISGTAVRDILIISPDTGYIQETIYDLKINSTVKDLAGNEIDRAPDLYKFQLNSLPPAILSITFSPGSSSPAAPVIIDNAVTPLADYNNLVDNLMIDVINSTFYTGSMQVTISFNKPIGPDASSGNINPISIWDSISAAHILGFSGDPDIIGSPIISGSNYTFEIGYLTVPNPSSDPNFFNEYQLKIKGSSDGLKDYEGNYLKDTITINFKVTGRNL